uniref:CSON015275 protein n=1 Tax=Culicoides sonorensis TaxID=179676 RepID=A0A336MGV9_CULSO
MLKMRTEASQKKIMAPDITFLILKALEVLMEQFTADFQTNKDRGDYSSESSLNLYVMNTEPERIYQFINWSTDSPGLKPTFTLVSETEDSFLDCSGDTSWLNEELITSSTRKKS